MILFSIPQAPLPPCPLGSPQLRELTNRYDKAMAGPRVFLPGSDLVVGYSFTSMAHTFVNLETKILGFVVSSLGDISSIFAGPAPPVGAEPQVYLV